MRFYAGYEVLSSADTENALRCSARVGVWIRPVDPCPSSFDLAVRLLIELVARGAVVADAPRRYLETLNASAAQAARK